MALLPCNKKKEDRNGFPDPISAQCFKCQKQFWIKFVVPQKDYSKKNKWSYWTEKKEDEGKFIDNFCLKDFYLTQRQEFLSTVKNLKKRNNLIGYIRKNFV
jgi:hypothetical protein